MTEQLNKATRTTEQELQAQLANLQEKIAKEVEMSAPEIGKLQSLSARACGKQNQLATSVQEFASHADELAALAQEKVAEVWSSGTESYSALLRRKAADGWEWKSAK